MKNRVLILEKQIKLSHIIIFLVGAVNVVFGLITVFNTNSPLIDFGFNRLSLVFGLIFILLGWWFQVSRKSASLWLAGILLFQEMIWAFNSANVLKVAVFTIIWVLLILGLIRGIKANNELNQILSSSGKK